MAINASGWLRETKAVYFDNATSVRDYRVQLRGNRSVILFGVYLVILIGVGMVIYGQTAGVGEIEVVEAQRKLKDFYGIIMALLGGLVSLIAPALTATTVVAERQRRSLDLIFSAPVSPKYFLVGKMMSTYRYTWMLLILSLPVTAACVVLGGASWGDVLTAYLLLSVQGFMLTAIALLLSTVSSKPVSAVLWSYIAAAAYLMLTASASSMVVARGFMSGGAGSREAPFFSSLNPFLVQMTSDTYTSVGSYHVPNWFFTICIAALVSKICLLSAGAILSPRPQEEIRSLRLHALVYMGAFLLYLTWSQAPTSGIGNPTKYAGPFLFWALSPMFLFMPFLSCFGVDTERRFWPNGAFKLRHTLDGTPSGGLPYVYLFILGCAAMIGAGFWFGIHKLPGVEFGYWLLYIAGFWSLFWAVGRYASATFVGLRSARALQFAAFVFLVLLPVPFFNSLTSHSLASTESSIWDLYVLRPLFFGIDPTADNLALIWGLVLMTTAGVVGYAAERKTQRKMELLRHRYDGDFKAA
ncbi:ABC transporter permease [Fimbriimonas ginsengisoli]|uniref:ABC-2 type transporter n=1 Tax=Fimbriimonas ginsengisoli Gsoil 348 TaxID=661478 RepID=A0A068NK08_FIMGI|nr:ABC transporter permease [Fimbriimonas ginsengisoli]AIE83928.1 ABC-2 type transporter [Fimbriimonas ginsengisoli Gsoil 348]